MSPLEFGNTIVNLISDGTYLRDGGVMFGQVPKARWELQVKHDRRNRIRLNLNCMLIQTPGKNILVDTGAGYKRVDELKEQYGMNANKLSRGLRNLGLTARDIHAVVLTSLQFDHAGGCTKLDRSGNAVPTFPKAEYIVQRSAWEEAMNPNERHKGEFNRDDFLPLEEKGLVKFVDGDYEIIPGVCVRQMPGPAKGHQIVLMERGSERFAFAGDLIPTAYHLSPTTIPALDNSPNDTLIQKRELLEMVVQGGWLIIFGHGYEQRAGYIRKRNGKPQFVPVEL
ncbi:MAG: MBL fold metallo-hydrolase [Nitrososphaera sp.]|nr:MBL fold metallo-hydrolase [Nitrososphaera sp.]